MSEGKRLIVIDDVAKIKQIDDPQISPDGKWIAYVVQATNGFRRGYERNIYMVSTAGGDPIQLTRSGKDSSPRWSPDGKRLAFVSARSEKPQIYVLPVGMPGEARALTSHENGAFAPAWSPDGAHIAYLVNNNTDERAREDRKEAESAPADELEGKHRKERKAEDEKNRWDPRQVERIPYRQGTSFMDDRHAQIYVIPTAEGLEGDAAKPRRLTSAQTSYSPPVWSKSGRTIVTDRAWDVEVDEYFRYGNIYLIDIETGIERRIRDEANNYSTAIPSYDGDWLICTRSPFGKTDAMARLTLIPLAGSGEAVELNLELDRSIYGYDWLPSGKLVVMVGTEGRFELHTLDPQTKQYSPILTEDQGIFGMSLTEQGEIALVSATTMRLEEVFFVPAGGEARQLTSVNGKLMDEIRITETHEIRYRNRHGQEIQGWYLLPPDFESGKQYPLALNIHGGPHVMWAPTARAMWHEWQVHAAQGYVVFYCNPRGSDGYGEGYQTALHAAWGEVAMDDIMAGVDSMIAQGVVDTQRMAITGGSYGGYMTAWIVGHTDRFCSAVTQRGVYNLTSFYGTSDVPILISSEFDTEPWEDPQKLWEHSPLAYAHHIKTPLLILHSENDFRVPIEQGEQLFAWVRRATDTPVKMVRFPREGHELSRSGEPIHRIQRLTEMVNWFNRYCQPEKLQQPASTSEDDE